MIQSNLNTEKDKTLEKFTLDEAKIKFLLNRYRAFLLPVAIIIVCVFLLFRVVGSQIQDLFTLRDETVVVKSKVDILKNNLNVLSAMDEESQDKQLKIVSSALPPYKDFAGILNAIIGVTVKSGVGLSDFSFVVGDISTKSATLAKSPALTIKLNIMNSSQNQTKQFIAALSQALPLADVKGVQASSNNAEITVLFYYKPFPLINLNYNAPIKDFTPTEKKLMETIASWQTDETTLDLEALTSLTSTPSAKASVTGESESVPFASQ